jgi:hypothetical protein
MVGGEHESCGAGTVVGYGNGDGVVCPGCEPKPGVE